MSAPHLDFAQCVLVDRAMAALRRDDLLRLTDDGVAVVRFPADALDRVDDLLSVAAASETSGSSKITVTVAVHPVRSLRQGDASVGRGAASPDRPVAEIVFGFDLARDEVTDVTQSFVSDLYFDRITSLRTTRCRA